MKIRSAVLAVAVLSGMVQVEFGGQTFVLGGGESRVFGEDRVAAPAEGGRGNAAVPAEGRAEDRRRAGVPPAVNAASDHRSRSVVLSSLPAMRS